MVVLKNTVFFIFCLRFDSLDEIPDGMNKIVLRFRQLLVLERVEQLLEVGQFAVLS